MENMLFLAKEDPLCSKAIQYAMAKLLVLAKDNLLCSKAIQCAMAKLLFLAEIKSTRQEGEGARAGCPPGSAGGQQHKQDEIEDAMIINMVETPVYFDIILGKPINIKGQKSIRKRTSSNLCQSCKTFCISRKVGRTFFPRFQVSI